MRRTFILATVLICVLMVSACNSAPAPVAPAPTSAPAVVATVSSAATALQAEIAALKAGDAAKAIDSLGKIIAANPGSAEAHLLLGQAYYRSDRKDDAENELMAGFTLDGQAALPLDTQDPDELFLAGNAHASVGQLNEALAVYEAVLKIKPDKAAAYTNLGVVYYQLGKLDEAITQMKKALDLDAKDAETWYMLGAAYTQQESLTEAEQAFNKSIELKPDLAPPYVGLGNVYLLRKDFAKAISTLQKATSLQSDLAEAWLALGQAYTAQGNQAEATNSLKQCVQFSQQGPLQARCQQLLTQGGTP